MVFINLGKLKPEFHINNSIIPQEKKFLYQGHPIRDDNFIVDNFNEKMNRVERSLYSLRDFGS